MLDFTFGPPERADRTAARINAIHRRVNGFLDESTARFPAGTPYTATDPGLLVWVHATLLDSMPLAYEHFVGPLSRDEKDAYCAESAATAARLGVPEEMLLLDSAGVRRYVDAAIAGDVLAVTAAARRVARHLLYPPLDDATRPGAWLNRLVTLGLLPPTVREAYGFPWKGRHERGFRLVTGTIQRLLPFTPPVIRYWHAARRRPTAGISD
jgi:uncharacterized protein (DUF2236 family)